MILSQTDLILIIQTAVLFLTLYIIIRQLNSSWKVERARFEFEIIKENIDRRAESHRRNPALHEKLDSVKKTIELAGGTENFLVIRGAQDFFNFAFRLKKERLIKPDTWKQECTLKASNCQII